MITKVQQSTEWVSRMVANAKNSIRDARTPQPREIFSTPSDIEVLYQYKVQDTFRALSVIYVVTPLIKKSSLSKDELKNYRPVSGLSFISKLVERVVASQLSRHVSLHGLENEYQSAYRRGHSTETALLSNIV